ncbi:MAG: hypothetical protein FWG83_05665 [Oscillospiraceae bacterium]|nr:hypothetical protein [Oscillospiraceae bacterium]
MKQKKKSKFAIEADAIVIAELKNMRLTFLLCNVIIFLPCLILAIGWGDWLLFWRNMAGLFLGNVAAILNFWHLGVKAGKILQRKNIRHAQTYGAFSFYARYFGAFAVFGVLAMLGIISVYTVVLPLLFPKIHYTIKAILNKEV